MTASTTGRLTSVGFGPWASGISETERIARLRALRALAHVLRGGPRQPLVVALRAAERDPVEAERALELLEALPALRRRRLLATYATLGALIAEADRTIVDGRFV